MKPLTVYLIGSAAIGGVASFICHGVTNRGFWLIIGVFHITCVILLKMAEKR